MMDDIRQQDRTRCRQEAYTIAPIFGTTMDEMVKVVGSKNFDRARGPLFRGEPIV